MQGIDNWKGRLDALNQRSVCWAGLAGGLVVAVLALRFFYLVSFEWMINRNYSFGGFVPVALVYLLWNEWRLREEAFSPKSRELPLFLIGASVVGVLVVELFSIVNPDWRLLMWLNGILVSTVALAYCHLAGGGKWTSRMFLCSCFAMLAVPLPTFAEQWILKELMQFVAERSSDILHLSGITSSLQGNTLRIDGHLLGISEACSGLKSLQMTVIAVLFMWIIWPFLWWQQLLFSIAALVTCVVVNILRIWTLGWLAASHGADSMEAWHDRVGYLATFLMVACILALAWTFRDDEADERAPLNFDIFPPPAPSRPPSLIFSVVILISFIVGVGIVQIYYGPMPEKLHRAENHLEFDWSALEVELRRIELSDDLHKQLRFDYGAAFGWSEGEIVVNGYYFGWEPGRVSSFSSVHRPENCLPSIGYRLLHSTKLAPWEMGGVTLPVYRMVFQLEDELYYVFYAGWDAVSGSDLLDSSQFSKRWNAVVEGVRFGPRQSIEFVVRGAPSVEVAENMVFKAVKTASK